MEIKINKTHSCLIHFSHTLYQCCMDLAHRECDLCRMAKGI